MATILLSGGGGDGDGDDGRRDGVTSITMLSSGGDGDGDGDGDDGRRDGVTSITMLLSGGHGDGDGDGDDGRRDEVTSVEADETTLIGRNSLFSPRLCNFFNADSKSNPSSSTQTAFFPRLPRILVTFHLHILTTLLPVCVFVYKLVHTV